MIQAEDADAAWIETALDNWQDIPAPSATEAQRAAHPEFDGWLWALLKLDPARLDADLEHINITLP